MKGKFFLFFTVFTIIWISPVVCCQNSLTSPEHGIEIPDSLPGKRLIYKPYRSEPEIRLTRTQAINYLQGKYEISNWNDPADPFRQALGRLICFASDDPYDSTKVFLEKYPYDSLNIPWERFFLWDTVKLKIPTVNSPVSLRNSDSLSALVPLKDTAILAVRDTLREVAGAAKGFPFRYYRWPFENDSIKSAVNSLIGFIEDRDSSTVNLSGKSGSTTSVWLNSKTSKLSRYWLRNEYSDSVTLWVGGVSRNTIGLFLEEGIAFRRPVKQSNFSEASLNVKKINSKSLQEIKQIEVKSRNWKLRAETAFVLSQVSLSNWVRGGESSFSTAMDLTGYADYSNKKMKVTSNNFIRLKYGLLKAGDDPVRKNQDLLESNSKLNHKAFGKFDFSAVMLFKTQISKGYNYPNDSVPVSRFLNPATLTFGLGLDFKPNKTTSINFSPLSYKGTFMTDTVHFDQTKYGIPHDRKSLHEPGASLLVSNELKLFKTITVTNRLQLFTNYIHNPQNIDVDWEMIVTSKINWFTDVRINTHLIFDDDTRTPVLYKDGTPKLGSDGKPRNSARVQFKELIGFTFVFRF
jgi:hypothetical protein